MTDSETAKTSFLDEFKAMTTKQWVATLAAFLICTFMVYTGAFITLCMGLGFLIIAVILYMLPHITGVSSPKMKMFFGVLFVVIILLISAFAYGGSATDRMAAANGNTTLTEDNIDYDNGLVTVTLDDSSLDIVLDYCEVSTMAFGRVYVDPDKLVSVTMPYSDGKYTYNVPLEDGKYFFIRLKADINDRTDTFVIYDNTGVSSSEINSMNFNGSIISVVEIALVYFIMVIFSELMRKSARKKRDQMIKDGRLYPEGYDKCKECGTMILPGEIVCRKCGAPIDVPEDVKVLHKKDYFECSECGTEVPLDAKFCPKCGAVFNEEDEIEVKHADGSVEITSEMFECSECGQKVPASADKCAFCGAKFDEEDE